MQDIEATVVSGNGTETGQIITTAIGGRDGQPKQVITLLLLHLYWFLNSTFCALYLHKCILVYKP